MSAFLGVDGACTPFDATFDGGARSRGNLSVAGAGAALWGPLNLHGYRTLLARATIALPAETSAQIAEAWGCRVALDLLLQVLADDRSARVSGDNLAVVRFCADQGRLRRPSMQAALAPALARVLGTGWGIEWLAVRRRLNQAADALATMGVFRAFRLAESGHVAPSLLVEWLPAAAPYLRPEA